MTQVAVKKQVKVLARIEYKRNAKAVVYICQSSNGKDQYRTTVYDGHATGCDCPSKVRCYHMTGCESLEALRRYDVVGAALQVMNRTVSDAKVGDFYEQRAKDMERTAYLNTAMSLGWE